MEHHFNLEVHYKGEELNLRVRLVTFGYTYKFFVTIEKDELVVERDDEMNYRIISANPAAKKIDAGLFAAIVTALEKLND